MIFETAGYPRPQLRREGWLSLDGQWEFALDPPARWTSPDSVGWTHTIRVPFAPETPASGIADAGFYRACWYRRTFDTPALRAGERLLLHFGAVDYQATVWVNGALVADHTGGYTPFAVDITDILSPGGPQQLVVRAFDDPHDLGQHRGKQDWLLEPHAIWYPRTTGIWQPVWLERVPAAWLETLRWDSSIERWQVGLAARVVGEQRDNRRLHVRLSLRDLVLADDTYPVAQNGEVARHIDLGDPGIDDARRTLLWSPVSPTLIQAELTLLDAGGDAVDRVRSYTALRSVRLEGDRFLLNDRPITLRMALDQGYWPASGLTPPDDAALRRDVLLARRMGFNGVRKHQKIEDPRYLYWADALGLMVWEEMPSVYRFTPESQLRLASEWTAAVERDVSHPCIVTWVAFNESWGVPALSVSAAQRHFVDGLYHLTAALDGSRPVVGNDGWEHATTDLLTVHDYASDPAALADRYSNHATLTETLARARPAGRLLVLPDHAYRGQPVLLTEFGGIGYAADKAHTWGYTRAESPRDLASAYTRLLATVGNLAPLSGFCYTQFADTYQEANGLLYMDRTPKFPLDEMARATRSGVSPREARADQEWEVQIGTPADALDRLREK
jgi:beta-galactosidase/beta-glucuronidase